MRTNKKLRKPSEYKEMWNRIVSKSQSGIEYIKYKRVLIKRT